MITKIKFYMKMFGCYHHSPFGPGKQIDVLSTRIGNHWGVQNTGYAPWLREQMFPPLREWSKGAVEGHGSSQVYWQWRRQSSCWFGLHRTWSDLLVALSILLGQFQGQQGSHLERKQVPMLERKLKHVSLCRASDHTLTFLLQNDHNKNSSRFLFLVKVER